MRPSIPVVLVCLVPAIACRPHAAAPAIPPPAEAAPLELADDDDFDDELDDEGPSGGPRAACEAPPKGGVASPDFARARETIAMVMRTSGTPSIAVAVARDGEILWEEGFGFADLRRRVRANEHTMYSLASISKPFTATAIMVLRERGLLTLEQPLSEILPPPGLWAGVGDPNDATVERVASHTSGLPLHYQFYYEDRDAEVPPTEVTRRRYAVSVTAPGERYQYSNLGFGLLGQAIEYLGDEPYPRFMREQVFEPLGLRHTFVGQPPRGSGQEAIRYDGRGKAIPRYGFDHDGASAIYSSAHDLVRFGMFHIGTLPSPPELLPAEARLRMQQPVAPADDYGLGWGLGRDDAVARVSHGGGMPGARTALRMFPEQGVVVVVLANSSQIGRDHVAIAREIEDALGLPARADDLCKLPAGHPLLRTWEGEIATIDGPRRFVLEASGTGELSATIGDGPTTIVRDIAFADGVLRGTTYGDVAAEQGGGKPTELGLELRLRGDRLQGGITAHVPTISATTLFASLSPAP